MKSLKPILEVSGKKKIKINGSRSLLMGETLNVSLPILDFCLFSAKLEVPPSNYRCRRAVNFQGTLVLY